MSRNKLDRIMEAVKNLRVFAEQSFSMESHQITCFCDWVKEIAEEDDK